MMRHGWMMDHGMYGVGMFSILPLLFWLAIIILLIILIVRLSRNKSGQPNDSIYQKLADSEQLQRESLRRQQELADEVKEVNERLKKLEQRLNENE